MKHSYINEGNKIYESKEVEIAREAELENVIENVPNKTNEYKNKVKSIQHKYGKDNESEKTIGTFE